MSPGLKHDNDDNGEQYELESQLATNVNRTSMLLFPKGLSQLEIPNPLKPFKRYNDHDDNHEHDSISTASSGDADYADEDDEKRFLRDSDDDRWHESPKSSTLTTYRRRRVWCSLTLVVIVLVLITTFLMSFIASGNHSFTGEHLKTMTIEHLANGTFWPQRESIDWLAEAGDGVYSYRTDDGSIVLEDVRTNSTRVLVDGDNVKDSNGRKLNWNRFKVSADLKYILFDSEYTKQWRHSSHANFWVHTVSTGKTTALLDSNLFPSSQIPHTAIATFSPTNHHIAFVHANDLYVYDNPPGTIGQSKQKPIRVTVDGSPTTFNGVPDWVYEEEVFGSDSALWWSPDGTKLAFLSFDEEKVPEYEFPIYNPSLVSPGAQPYPSSIIMRYPKPGYPNPIVKISMFDLATYLESPLDRPTFPNESDEQTLDPRVKASTFTLEISDPFNVNDTIINEVAWVGNDDLMIKLTNRIADRLKVTHFKFEKQTMQQVMTKSNKIEGKVVRDNDFAKIDGGWVEPAQTMIGIESTISLHSNSSIDKDKYPNGYLDIVPNDKGWNHIAFFSPPDSNQPLFLTNGEWEVVDGIKAVDVVRGLIYFVAANPSTSRHVYSVSLPTSSEFKSIKTNSNELKLSLIALTNSTQGSYFKISFSPFGGFYVLENQGPLVPWQKLITVDDDENNERMLVNNSQLVKIDAEFQQVDIVRGTVEVNGVELNTLEMRPPFMDVSGRTKYPVLFQVYGGPNSQLVSQQWQRDWHHYLVTSLEYIIVRVDPRGTGFKSRPFRMSVRNQLGSLESKDVIETMKIWENKNYIDSKRIGIWGWSFGGYLVTKIVELNETVLGLAMSVAPVTDWRFYDSIYTERYMSTPQLNPVGYRNSSVRKMEGFKNVEFALAHGSGDDNVHYLNTAALLDRFTVEHVRNFHFRMFTDSDHSISMRGAYWELMHWLTEFLLERWGEGGRTKQRWRLREFEWDFGGDLDDSTQRL
ncbi:Dipeptidyl peptidase 4 [Microbotryomycetes sp. JL221]|nr:Dipeptidyl peptidase 4 [Microbotryomycetes sp. JL221]